jgi:hypothetical protein
MDLISPLSSRSCLQIKPNGYHEFEVNDLGAHGLLADVRLPWHHLQHIGLDDKSASAPLHEPYWCIRLFSEQIGLQWHASVVIRAVYLSSYCLCCEFPA